MPLKQQPRVATVQLWPELTVNSRAAASAKRASLQLPQQHALVHRQGAGRQQLLAPYRL